MKRERTGFTLLELLVTMGIMAFLGIAASGGYHAIVRGMTERGVCASASAALRAAKGRAQIDRRHVAVFCYNRLLREPSGNGMEAGSVVGILAAVRRTGRLSAVSGKFLYDEFGDLELCYECLPKDDLERHPTVRLYKFNDGASKMEYSLIADASYIDDQMQLWLPDEEASTNGWVGAYYNVGGSDHEPSWSAGDGYGFEFLEIQLPDGYIFGQQVPQSLGQISIAKVIDFNPEQDQSEAVEVWSTKPTASGVPKAWKKSGEAKSDDSSI